MAGKTLEQQLADLEAKTDKTPEQIKAIGILKDKVKAKEDKAKEKIITKKELKEGDNDFQDYQKFAELKFLQWNGERYEKKNLKPKVLEQFEKLEKQFKDYPGKIPTRDKTVAVDIESKRLKLVKGFGVPESLYQIFVKSETLDVDKYFE